MSRPFHWNRIPTAVWAYGLLRAIAFGAPILTAQGNVGLGVLIVLPLYVFLVRGSRLAWAILVVLDAISPLLLVLSLGQTEVPLSVPLLTATAFATLLAPSTRRYVGAAQPASTD